MTDVRGSKLRTGRKTIIGDKEFQQILMRAQEIKEKFFRLRALALLCILRLTGKRRTEVARLEINDFKIEKSFINVTFTLLKKRVGKRCPGCAKTSGSKTEFCRYCGEPIAHIEVKPHTLRNQSTKTIPLTDPLTEPILEWLHYLNTLKTTPKFFLPRMRSIFGHNIIQSEAHIGGRQVFNIVRQVSDEVWPHLFRESAAADVVKKDPSIFAAFKVMRRLDLEDFRTGFNYLKRFAADVIEREQDKEGAEADVIQR